MVDEAVPATPVDVAQVEQPDEPASDETEPQPEADEPTDETGDPEAIDEAPVADADPSVADSVDESAIADQAADVVVTLNGTPLTQEGSSKLTGCTIDMAADFGSPTPVPRVVRLKIAAVAPTAPEGAPATLVDEVTNVTTSEWTSVHDMTALLGGFEQKPNGYRLEVSVTIDDVPSGQKQVWLACGAPQDGSPNRILFEVEWLDHDGVPVSQPLDAVLPAGWRDSYSLWATSDRGVAACTYPAGSDVLTCNYDNPGHGSKPGLLVPGGKKFTYDVVQIGLPSGWQVDAETIGTFLGRETCPRGGHHDDEHEEHAEAAAHEDSESEPCVHTVTNVQAEPPTPPPTEPPATKPSDVARVQDVALSKSPVGVSKLPATGSQIDLLLLAGLLTIAAGALMVLIAARLGIAPSTSPDSKGNTT